MDTKYSKTEEKLHEALNELQKIENKHGGSPLFWLIWSAIDCARDDQCEVERDLNYYLMQSQEVS